MPTVTRVENTFLKAFVIALLLGSQPLVASLASAERKDWHIVTGPEDLDQAVSNARGYQQPAYEEPVRFDRSTHISFPLAPLPGESMARQAIDGALDVATEPGDKSVALPAEVIEGSPDNLSVQRLGTSDTPNSITPSQPLRSISQVR